MNIESQCPTCNAKVTFDQAESGQFRVCPNCALSFKLPGDPLSIREWSTELPRKKSYFWSILACCLAGVFLIGGMAGASLGSGILAGFIVLLYFAPAINAEQRGHQSLGSIAVVTLLLGWTFLGRVVALALSASALEPQRRW